MDRETSLGAQALEIDPRRVVHETVDDETIIIDLESGSYFSLAGSGPEIWSLVASGAPVRDVVEALESRYPDDAPGDMVLSLIDQLLSEGLVEAVPAKGHGELPPVPGTGARRSFSAPELVKFTDLQELLLLDPVHEIDEAGWPHQRQP